MRRAPVSLTVVVMLLLLAASSALAAPPTREPLELPPSIDFAPGEACPFGVHVEFLVNREKVMTFTDSSGEVTRAITTGTLKIRISRADDPDMAVTLNISGPGHDTFHPDGTSTKIFGGRAIPLYPPGSFTLTTGRAVIQLDAAGNYVSMTNTGTLSDVCEMLAS